MLRVGQSITTCELKRSEFTTISKTDAAKKGWVIGRNGLAMPRSAFNLSEILEDQRKEADLTKAAFARKLGIPKQTLHRLLNGQANPTMDFVTAIADKLELDFHPIFTLPSPRMLSVNDPRNEVGASGDDQTEKAKKRRSNLDT